MHQGTVSEDCLYLNVWTAARTGERRPVLVYIHGGAFNEGSGAVAVYDGTSLAARGLVVVTINYRLGVLGFLAHPELSAEAAYGGSGNYGLLDQVAALRWVQRNIAAFGGDPGNVTIAGQSAGAMSVYLLTASPLASGLFHRAISQSGPGGLAAFGRASTRGLATRLAEAEANGAAFASENGAASLAALRALPVNALLAGVPAMRFGPVIDGYLLPDEVGAIYATGAQNDVPLLTGFNADEASAFPGYGRTTAAAFAHTARQRFGPQADEFLALYPVPSDAEAGEAQKASQRDMAAVALSLLIEERAQTATTDAYLYFFARGIPWPDRPEFGAFHTAEVPYVFGTLDVLDRPWEPADRALADAVASYWINFATSGDPNGPGLPAWPPYRAAATDLQCLGVEVRTCTMPTDDAHRAFFSATLHDAP